MKVEGGRGGGGGAEVVAVAVGGGIGVFMERKVRRVSNVGGQ